MRTLKKNKPSVPLWGMEVDEFWISMRKRTVSEYLMTAEHLHKHYEMMFNFSRIPISHTAGGRRYTSDTPCILFRAPYVLHSINTAHTYTRTGLAFHPCILSEYANILDLGRLRGHRECMIPCTEEQMEYLDQLLSRMQKIWRTGKSEKPWIALLAEVLYEVSEMLPDDMQPAGDTPPYIQDLLLYVVENIGDDLSAQTLARKYFVGHTKLAKDFKASLGITLLEYVTAIRLTQAKRWLTEGVSIDAIASRCGYAQESSFIYMFRRQTGMTPGEWRRNMH